MWEILYLSLGIIIGLLVNPFRNETQEALKRFSKKLPHKMGEIVGLSSEEQDFQDSLNNSFKDKVIK
jgi:hypothetical protein